MAAHQNRLAASSSPYLLQHAGNPVDWFPWGAEALEKSKREDKPILLSIGYAACHWCHVMEHESFENEETAALMNELFVSIKVDREERPDPDHLYQLVVQLMGRSGGWPLTVFLTPDQRPYFAGTYFPPADRHGMPGFPTVLASLAEAYREQRGAVFEQALEITQAIGRAGRVSAAPGQIGLDALRRASRKLIARFDDRNGGFGGKPKFPNTMSLDVLLRRGALEGDEVAKESVALALQHMRAGGIGTTSAAASTATRPTSAGWCPTSRRCSTTTRSCSGSTPTDTASSARRPTPRRRARSPGICSPRCATTRTGAPSSPRRTPTPRAARARSSSGRRAISGTPPSAISASRTWPPGTSASPRRVTSRRAAPPCSPR